MRAQLYLELRFGIVFMLTHDHTESLIQVLFAFNFQSSTAFFLALQKSLGYAVSSEIYLFLNSVIFASLGV